MSVHNIKFRKINLFAIYFFILFITGCRCDDPVLCPPLSDAGIEWINKMHNLGDTVVYQNNFGENLKFYLSAKEISPSSLTNACDRDGFRCNCETACSAYGTLQYEPDSNYSVQNYYNYRIYESYNKGTISLQRYSFTIFDLSRNLYDLNNALGEADSFYTSLTIDTSVYSNVHVFSVDTTISFNENKKVWKAYISFEEGIIAFWERPSNTLFIRQ